MFWVIFGQRFLKEVQKSYKNPKKKFIRIEILGKMMCVWSVKIFGLEVRVDTPGKDWPDMVRGSLACFIFVENALDFWAMKGPSEKCFQKLII